MDATLILIDSDAELARARALVDRLWESDEPADVARLQAQARLIAAYEEAKWPRRPPSTANLIRHLMDQHDLTRADKNQDEHDASRFRVDLAQLICRFFVERRRSSCLLAGPGRTLELPLLRRSFAIRAQEGGRQTGPNRT